MTNKTQKFMGWAMLGIFAATALPASTPMRDLAIVSSVINGTPIGAGKPSTGNFTNLTAAVLTVNGPNTVNGNLSVSGDTNVTGAVTATNVNTGALQISGTGPQNHMLCGNGSSYVDATSCGSIQGSQYPLSHSAGATYTNTSGVLVYETGWFLTSGSDYGTLRCSVNGITVYASTVGATVDNGSVPFSFLVPAGGTYSCYGDRAVNRGVGGWYETSVK